MNKYSIFGLNYCATDYENASDLIIEQAKIKNSFTVASLPVHGLIEAYWSEKFRKTANNIDFVVPDGFPIVWALNKMYKLGLKDRVNGIDLSLHILDKAGKNNLNVFLYGSYEDTVNKFAQFINQKYPGVVICGKHPDRFREATEDEDKRDIEMINNSEANLVLVGRGCPRQEYWVESHKKKINAVMIGIGGAFDIHSQKIKRAPKWMQEHSLEWLFRLLQEPKRLWKRYLFTNTAFVLLMLKYYLKKPFTKKNK
jgi:exopolysaccharide biosynthesis WecB/TagA/CpsF family protein